MKWQKRSVDSAAKVSDVNIDASAKPFLNTNFANVIKKIRGICPFATLALRIITYFSSVMGLCRIEPSRGYDVIEEFMRECEAEVWVWDC